MRTFDGAGGGEKERKKERKKKKNKKKKKKDYKIKKSPALAPKRPGDKDPSIDSGRGKQDRVRRKPEVETDQERPKGVVAEQERASKVVWRVR